MLIGGALGHDRIKTLWYLSLNYFTNGFIAACDAVRKPGGKRWVSVGMAWKGIYFSSSSFDLGFASRWHAMR